jgi:hypothetical protein
VRVTLAAAIPSLSKANASHPSVFFFFLKKRMRATWIVSSW